MFIVLWPKITIFRKILSQGYFLVTDLYSNKNPQIATVNLMFF